MPLPLAHGMIGLVAYEAGNNSEKKGTKLLKVYCYVIALSNFSDIDYLVSKLLVNDWFYYHRLYTHNLIFCLLLAGIAFFLTSSLGASYLKIGYWRTYAIIASHPLADYFIGDGKFSLISIKEINKQLVEIDFMEVVLRLLDYIKNGAEIEIIVTIICLFLILWKYRISK